MGSRSPEEYVTLEEAADILDVCLSTVQQLVRKGTLIPDRTEGGLPRFRRSDVQMIRIALREESTDLHEVKALALQALSMARRAEERLGQMAATFGLDFIPVSREPSAVQELHEEARGTPSWAQVSDHDWVKYWGGCLFSMDEVYLQIVETETGDDDPWKPFLDFSGEVLRMLCDPKDPAPESVIRYFRAARNHLLHVSYLYCRRTHGRQNADSIFDGRVKAVDEICALL